MRLVSWQDHRRLTKVPDVASVIPRLRAPQPGFIGLLSLALLLVMSTPVSQLHAQVQGSPGGRIWFRGGYDPPTGIVLQLAGQYKYFVAEARIATKEVIADAVGGADVGILVGFAPVPLVDPYIHVSLSAGIAHTWFYDCDAHDRCPTNPGAAPALALHASVRPSSFFGLGLFAYANLNNVERFGGTGVMIEIGKLR